MTSKPLFDAESVQKIHDALKDVNLGAGEELKNLVTTLIDKTFNQGLLPKTTLQIGDDTMEAMYAQAYNLYNQGKYTEASYIFRLLMMLDYSTAKYSLGLAACLHRLKQYALAANMYMMCSLLDQKNPLPHYHASDCYLQDKQLKMAIVSLEMAIRAAGDQPQYAVLKQRAILMKDGLEDQFIKEHWEAAKKEAESQGTGKKASKSTKK